MLPCLGVRVSSLQAYCGWHSWGCTQSLSMYAQNFHCFYFLVWWQLGDFWMIEEKESQGWCLLFCTFGSWVMTLDWNMVGGRRGYWRRGRAGKDPGSWKLRQVVLFHFFFFLWFYDCKLAVAGQLWLYLLEADVRVNLRFLRLKTIESGTMK